MKNNALAIHNAIQLVPDSADKDTQSRLRRFEAWCDTNNQPLTVPRLNAYRDAMVNDGLMRSTIAAHLSTIRARYRALLRDSAFSQHLYDIAWQRDGVNTVADAIATVNELRRRVEDAIHPASAPIKLSKKQDVADGEHLRLTPDEVNRFFQVIKSSANCDGDLMPVVDRAIVALMLCTGIRREELVNLRVGNLRQRLDGQLALQIIEGKGAKSRLIPYGNLSWCLNYVDEWMLRAGLNQRDDNAYVFRALSTNRKRARANRMSVRSVNTHFERYQLTLYNGDVVTVEPHDLRRTYAKNWYCAYGHDGLLALKFNLGHDDLKTTMHYVGVEHAEKRAPDVNFYDVE